MMRKIHANCVLGKVNKLKFSNKINNLRRVRSVSTVQFYSLLFNSW